MSDPVKLNAGGGDKLGKERGYINLDLRQLPKTGLGASISNLPFASNTVDEVLASDILEHVPRHMLLATMAEIFRALKLGGIVKIKMPDLRALSQEFVDGKIDVHEFSRKLYGNQESEDPANFHKSGLDPAGLKTLLEAVGFSEVRVKMLDGADSGNMGARATKLRLSK